MFSRHLLLCCVATLSLGSSASAQNSRINEQGQQQMNDASPVDAIQTKEEVGQDFQMFPEARSPDGAAVGPSTGEEGSGEEPSSEVKK